MAAACWKDRGVNQKKPSSAVRAPLPHTASNSPRGWACGQDLPRRGTPTAPCRRCRKPAAPPGPRRRAGCWLRERSPRGTGSRRPSGRGGRRWLPCSFPPPGTGALCPRLGLPSTVPGRRRLPTYSCPAAAATRVPWGVTSKKDTPLTHTAASLDHGQTAVLDRACHQKAVRIEKPALPVAVEHREGVLRYAGKKPGMNGF